jgi:hypothetical protein
MKPVEEFYWLELNPDGSMNNDMPPKGPFISKDDAMKWLVEDTAEVAKGSESPMNENWEEWSGDYILVKSIGKYHPVPNVSIEVEVRKV